MILQRHVLEFAIAAWLLSLGVQNVSAQTLEIQEEITGFIVEERDPFGFLSWTWRWANILNTEIDIVGFGERKSLHRTLGSINEEFAKRGRGIRGEVDLAAFANKGTGLDDVVMDLSNLPERVTLSRLLVAILDQLPDQDATIVLGHSHFEITTLQVAGRRGISFHLARRIAPVARIWFWAGIACAAVYLLLRAPAVMRKPENRLAACVWLLLKIVAVGLFWPAWLVVFVTGMIWKPIRPTPDTNVAADTQLA